jgi:AcrR family transcriptional regulator
MKSTGTKKGTAREHILEVAAELFYKRGIKAVGVDTIIAEAGVAKMSFYNHYKSKDLLVEAYIKRRDIWWRGWLQSTVERLENNLQDRPLAIFDALVERFTNPEFRGCAFINVLSELADEPQHPAYQAALEHKQQVLIYIKGLLEAAGVSDPAKVARQFMLLLDGALVTAGREHNVEAAATARQIAKQLLEKD